LRGIATLAWGRRGYGLTNREFEIEFANSDSVARIQQDFAAHPLIIDKCTVCAAQITDMYRKVVNGKDAVMPADKFAVWA
jgi:hypothetical protein